MKKLHPIMFAGTGSDVGKSIIAAAFCRIFHQDGYRPAPFKAQNMALNSYATPEGLEIGRAQAVQAEAAGVPCHTDMNPLLLNPLPTIPLKLFLTDAPLVTAAPMNIFAAKAVRNCGAKCATLTTALPCATIPSCWKVPAVSPRLICATLTSLICLWLCMPLPTSFLWEI